MRFTEWCPELETELARPFDKSWVKEKRQGGRAISFVHWHLYVHRLNELVGPGWSMGDPILRDVGGKLVMGLPVTILGVTRINFGSEEAEHGEADDDGKVRDFGSAETNSFAQALKRTLALFGLGLYLYDKDGLLNRPQPLTKTQREHVALMEWIGTQAKEAGPEREAKINGAIQGIQAYVKANWPEIKSRYAVARMVADALESELGVKFTPPA